MTTKLINLVVFFALGLLLMAQSDELGASLWHGYHGLLYGALACLVMCFLNVLSVVVQLVHEAQDDEDEEEIHSMDLHYHD